MPNTSSPNNVSEWIRSRTNHQVRALERASDRGGQVNTVHLIIDQ